MPLDDETNDMQKRHFGIGEIARRAGVTVRALRHYDAIGLLRPAYRTAAGHRAYGMRELERLERILLFRQMGLPLEEIAEAIDSAGQDLAVLLRSRIDAVERQLSERAELLQRLRFIVERLDRGEVLAADDLLETIEVTAMIEKHYSPEQRAQLEQRRQSLGEDEIRRVQQTWADLFARIDNCRVRGVDPAAAELAPMVDEARQLMAAFTGGDSGLETSLQKTVAETSNIHEMWGIDKALADYYFDVLRQHGD